MKHNILRTLAAALAVYLALSLGRSALLLRQELHRAEDLRSAIAETGAEIARLEQERSMPDEAVRLWAFRTRGLAGPEDVVFFDGGK